MHFNKYSIQFDLICANMATKTIVQAYGEPTFSTQWSMDDLNCPPLVAVTEIEILKNNLNIKEHEVFYLRGELERLGQSHQLLLVSIERLEKTMATCYDRLLRKIDRLSGGDETRKRCRRG